jgi:hypothetical protein
LATFSTRLRHIVTRADWAALLTPSYAAATSVEEELALERLQQALADASLVEALHAGLEAALNVRREEAKAPTTDDALLDRFAKAVQKRRGRVRAAPSSPEVSAVFVRVDLELGLAPGALGDTLASPKGAKLLEAGFRALGAHVAGELLR